MRTASPAERSFRRYQNRHTAIKLLEELGDPHPVDVAPVAVKLRLARPADHDPKATQLTLLEDAAEAPAASPAAAQPAEPPAAAVDFGDPDTLLERCMIVEPAISPRFAAAMIAAGASRRGARSFYVPVDPKRYAQNAALTRALAIIPAAALTDTAAWESATGPGARARGVSRELGRLRLDAVPRVRCDERPATGPLSGCGVLIRASDRGLWVKVCTRPGGWVGLAEPLHRWSARDVLPCRPVFCDEALRACWHAAEHTVELLDVDGVLADLDGLVRGSASARQVPSMPNLAVLIEGQPAGDPVRVMQTTAGHAHRIVTARQRAGDRIAMHFRVADAAVMSLAKASLDPALLGPQARLVAQMAATEIGALNASTTGSGKTVMTLRAMRAVAQTMTAYRALVVCGKPLRSQWAHEEIPHPEHGFCEARVLVADGRHIAGQLAAFDRCCGEAPGVIVTSYEMTRLRTDEFRVLTYDHLIIDEAARLGNPATQTARSLQRIRGRARVCFALTATPVGRSVDELDAIVGVVRDDPEMIRRRTIGRTFTTPDGSTMRRLREAFGPTLLRITRSDLAAFMPDVPPAKHQMLDPTNAERELIYAAEHRVAELHRDLLGQLDAARALDPRDPALEAARTAMASTRGLLVSAGEIALLASVDPEALLHSHAKAASMLIASGLVQEALDRGVTLRTVIAETIAGAVAAGEPVLAFSQFSSAPALLQRELADVHGVEVGLFTGQTPEAEREILKRRFQAGELRCLLLGPVGEQGLNLQTQDSEAQVVIHLDLPWVPRVLEQRTGRAGRIGGSARAVHTLVPYLRGSTMARVANLLIPRAATAHAALDQSGGVEPSEIARQLGGLAGELAGQGGSVLMQVCASILASHAPPATATP